MIVNKIQKPDLTRSQLNSETNQAATSVAENQQTTTRLRIRIPKDYHQEPIISRLISHYGLTVNILAALLGANTKDDGWFDLELRGTLQQLQSAQIYMNDLDLEVLSPSKSQEFCW